MQVKLSFHIHEMEDKSALLETHLIQSLLQGCFEDEDIPTQFYLRMCEPNKLAATKRIPIIHTRWNFNTDDIIYSDDSIRHR
jgi:hypothetical protein